MSILSTRRRTGSLLPNYVILIVLAWVALAPIAVLFFNSLKTTTEIGQNPLGFPQAGLQWQNYVDAWTRGRYPVTIRNSIIVIAGTIAGVSVIAGLAAYALARLNLPGADSFIIVVLILTSLPAQLFLVPLFFLWQKLGLINTLQGLIVIYWATSSPFATFLLRSYMVAIPMDFEDAARIDGANTLQIIRYVMLPIVWPGFLTVALLTGLGVWNEFLFATTFVQDEHLRTAITSYNAFSSRYGREWALTNAAAVITILPVMIFFLLLQRRFIEGLTQGGLRS